MLKIVMVKEGANLGNDGHIMQDLKSIFDVPCTNQCLEAIIALSQDTETEPYYKTCCQFLFTYIGLVNPDYLLTLIKNCNSLQMYRLIGLILVLIHH